MCHISTDNPELDFSLKNIQLRFVFRKEEKNEKQQAIKKIRKTEQENKKKTRSEKEI
jgi:hypothetical protein